MDTEKLKIFRVIYSRLPPPTKLPFSTYFGAMEGKILCHDVF